MTDALYLKDSYLQTFDAIVTSANAASVILDRTAFYATSGGQPHDTGAITCNNKTYRVLSVKKTPEGIVHELDQEGLATGDRVHGTIDWTRRYALMRSHTATHLLCTVLHRKTGSLITGNQIDVDKTRVDFNFDQMDRSLIDACIAETNTLIASNLPVTTYFVNKQDAINDPTLVKLANKDLLDKLGPEIRIVTIGDADRQIDGGTHVKNTSEIGAIRVLSVENKGKNHRRVYFTLT